MTYYRNSGRGFTPRVKTGDKIKRGQLLLEFDISEIEHGVPLLRVHLH
ncbi:PTS glucose transporter subunit IIA [Paenibacillus sp. FSL R10-2771]